MINTMSKNTSTERVKRAIKNLSNLKEEVLEARTTLGAAIREWRVENNISADEFAAKHNVSKPFLCMMELGDRPVPQRFIKLFQ